MQPHTPSCAPASLATFSVAPRSALRTPSTLFQKMTETAPPLGPGPAGIRLRSPSTPLCRYSFVLNTLVGAIYTFGFIMMTPQLFINYKLKSVAHLPWRTFVYKGACCWGLGNTELRLLVLSLQV